MGRALDLAGQRFHHLVAIERVGTSAKGSVEWRCKCDCGNFRVTTASMLRHNQAKSCGKGECDQRRSEDHRIKRRRWNIRRDPKIAEHYFEQFERDLDNDMQLD